MSCESLQIIFYYKTHEQIYYTDDYKTVKSMASDTDLSKCRHFKLMKGYDCSEKDLLAFSNDMLDYHNRISKTVKYYPVNYNKRYPQGYKYLDRYCHKNAVQVIWWHLTQPELRSASESIDKNEYLIMDKCLNSGLMTIDRKYINVEFEAFSYDFSSAYPHWMSNPNFIFPMSTGEKQIMESLDFSKLQLGIYRVNIIFINPSFEKVFKFSKNDHYTSNTLMTLYKYKDDFGLEFQLLEADETYDYNAYVYNESMNGYIAFNKWFQTLYVAKQKDKNPLIKHLLSSLWGTLCQYKSVYITKDELVDYDISYNDDSEYKIIGTLHNVYKCINTNDAYAYTCVRLKPFLTSFGRDYMLEYIMRNNLLKKLVAIHTDRFTFKKEYTPPNDNKYHPIYEEKSSGLLTFRDTIHYSKN